MNTQTKNKIASVRFDMNLWADLYKLSKAYQETISELPVGELREFAEAVLSTIKADMDELRAKRSDVFGRFDNLIADLGLLSK